MLSVSSWYFKENAFAILFDVDIIFWLTCLVRIGSIEYKVEHTFESWRNAASFAASANQEPTLHSTRMRHSFSSPCFIRCLVQVWTRLKIFRLFLKTFGNISRYLGKFFKTFPNNFRYCIKKQNKGMWVVLQKLPQLSDTHFSQVLNRLEKHFFHGFIKYRLSLHFI